MNEHVLAKSIKAKNYFIVAGLVLFFAGFLICELGGMDSIVYCIYPWAISFYYVQLSVILLIIGIIYNGTEIVITDKRAYGKSLFGKLVDLPLDSISAVGSFWPKGVSISTSSGRVSFSFIKNRNEIHKCVSDLLIERQSRNGTNTIIQNEYSRSDADELKKFRELLDTGVITQEEFDAKKKQLLGL